MVGLVTLRHEDIIITFTAMWTRNKGCEGDLTGEVDQAR